MRALIAFGAGALSVAIFHQGALALLYALGVALRAPYAMTVTEPFGVPQVVSLAFWGGIWGLVLWPALSRIASRPMFWVAAVVLGALGPSLVAWFVVAPLKGQPIAGGWRVSALGISLLVNGAWGIGLATGLRLAERFRIGGSKDTRGRPHS